MCFRAGRSRNHTVLLEPECFAVLWQVGSILQLGETDLKCSFIEFIGTDN